MRWDELNDEDGMTANERASQNAGPRSRYFLDRHTDHPFLCWRVVDSATLETFGYGLHEEDAARIAEELEAP